MMSTYDDYFTNDDKPFAENLNDALLLSNVFDLTVPIELPKMFAGSAWINTISNRKAGVSIISLKEQLPNGISISTDEGNSVLTGSGVIKLGFYPNFNSFGRIKSITWENEGDVLINLKDKEGHMIAESVEKGTLSNLQGLRTLQEFIIEIVMTDATLHNLKIIMQNKNNERYGAEAGISDVTGLENRLTTIENKDTAQDSRLDILEVTTSQLFDLIYPVGSIYMSVNSSSPELLFGGQWERIQGRFLLGAGDTYSAGSTGGSADAVVVNHNHTQNSHNHTQNSHNHGTNSSEYDKFLTYSGSNIAINSIGRRWTSDENGSVFYVYEQSGDGGITEPTKTGEATATNNPATGTNNPSGVDGTGKNMPPYLAVYAWKRVG